MYEAVAEDHRLREAERTRTRSYGVEGRMTMERPKNFKLEISTGTSSNVANMRLERPRILVLGATTTRKSAAFTFAITTSRARARSRPPSSPPDWIVEAMGLHFVIPEDEAAEIQDHREARRPGQARPRPIRSTPGRRFVVATRVTIIDKASNQILEHQIRSGDQKSLLARAEVPDGYMRGRGRAPRARTRANESVVLPKRILLYWIQEKLEPRRTVPHP